MPSTRFKVDCALFASMLVLMYISYRSPYMQRDGSGQRLPLEVTGEGGALPDEYMNLKLMDATDLVNNNVSLKLEEEFLKMVVLTSL